MEKTSTLNVKVNSDIKQRSEEILTVLGIPISTAVDMFLHQICLKNGIPFSLILPVSSSDSLNYDLEIEKDIFTKSEINCENADEILKEFKKEHSL